MLLAKLFYCSGEFNDALQLIDCVKFSVKQCSSFSRLFYIFAEAYAIKGLLLVAYHLLCQDLYLKILSFLLYINFCWLIYVYV